MMAQNLLNVTWGLRGAQQTQTSSPWTGSDFIKTQLVYRPVLIHLWWQGLCSTYGSSLLLHCTPASVLWWTWPHLGQTRTTVVEYDVTLICSSQQSEDKCSAGVLSVLKVGPAGSGENFHSPLTWAFTPSLHRSKLYQTAPLKERSPLT